MLVSLANTGELLYLMNRSGNRPSEEGAANYIDRAIKLCREAGFRKITVRGDTAFSQTQHLDRWHNDGVQFVFGYDRRANLVKIAEELPESHWSRLKRPAKYEVETEPRTRLENVKERIIVEREVWRLTQAPFKVSLSLMDRFIHIDHGWQLAVLPELQLRDAANHLH